jgi:DNA mismatch repair protein MutS2
MFVEEKTLKDLEWYVILEDLAGQASSKPGKELCLSLNPQSDIEEVRHELTLTTEAKSMLQQAIDPPLSSIYDIREAVQNACKGITLEAEDFKNIGSTLTAAQKLKAFFEKQEETYPQISHTASFLIDPSKLLDQIFRCFEPSGILKDTASPALKQLKDSLRDQTSNLKDRFNSIMHSQAILKYLQEPVYTMRNERYVLPVKAEHKSHIPGIVHDSSASGATIYIEPRELVEINNRIKETELNIEHEIHRILADLTHKVAQEAEIIYINMDIMARIDSIFAKARYSKLLDAGEPEINTNKVILLRMARHPILIRTIKKVVANTVTLGEEYNTLIVTGANAGGKTVMLKTIGLCLLMAASGMHIPAESDSSIYLYSSVFCEIGEHQSIEQNLSTFSAHMKGIINIVNRADQDSLILIDELGAGTDPAEGTALAQALLEHLNNKEANTVVTTHYGGLKTLAFSHKGFYNASVEFDLETLTPTFKLLMGIPGKSNATTIAKNLGLKKDIVERAREIYTSTEDDFSLMLDELQKVQKEVNSEYNKAKSKHEYAEELKAQYEKYLEKFNATRSQALHTFRRNLNSELSKARAEVLEILSELRAERTEKTAKRAHSELAGVDHRARKKIDYYRQKLEKKEGPQPVNWQKAKTGDTVLLKDIGQTATIVSLPDKNNKVVVQMGLIKTTVRAEDLYQADKKKTDDYRPSFKVKDSVTKSSGHRNINNTCDLRGKTVEDGLQELEIYLDKASLTGMPSVYVIHGHGTGALRKAVREYLKSSPYVKEFRPGKENEGGDGISVVDLV